MMGLNKSLRMFPESVREVITQHLIEIYSNIYTFKTFGDEFTSDIGFTSCIMEVFGGDSEDGVDVGEYSYLAKLLEASDLIGLQEADIKTKSIRARVTPGPAPISMKRLNSHLQEAGWEQADIERLHVQLNEAHCNFNLMMLRMRQFRAGARLHYIAAQLLALGDGSVVNQNDETIPSHITFMIKEVTRVLEQNDEQDTWRSLVKIQRNQLEGGNRLTLLSQLGAKRNRGEEITADELAQLVASLADGTSDDDAMAMIQNQAEVQRENGERLGQIGSLLNQLAAKQNRGEEITADELAQLKLSLADGTSDEDAMDMINNVASRCDETFCRRFGQLKKYKENNHDDVVNVNGVNVLTIESDRSKFDSNLGAWLNTQNGYHYANNMSEYECGVKAYKRMGSIEQLALEGIGVTFDPNLHKKAMNIRAANKSKKNAGKKRNGIMGLIRG